MIPEGYAVTDKQQLEIFAGMIAQTQAESVLDVGMLLLRAGAVSRAFEGFGVPESVCLCGLQLSFLPVAEKAESTGGNASADSGSDAADDMEPGDRIPICRVLYDAFADTKERDVVFGKQHFDLAIMIGLPPTLQKEEKKDLLDWIGAHAALCVTDAEQAICENGTASSEFMYKGRSYRIIRFS